MENEILKGDRLYLRKMTLDDSALIVAWRNQDWVRKNYIYREQFTLDGQKAYFHNKIETGEVVQFIVCELENDRPVGCTILNDFDYGNGHAEYGMFLGERTAAGKGYSSEMVRLTLHYAFADLRLKRVVCRIFTDNIPSIKGCERGGFRIADTMPDVECSDGTVKDMYLLEVHSRDFLASQEESTE